MKARGKKVVLEFMQWLNCHRDMVFLFILQCIHVGLQLYYYGLEAVKGVFLLQTSWLHFRHQEEKRNTRSRTFISKAKTQKSSSCVYLELCHISYPNCKEFWKGSIFNCFIGFLNIIKSLLREKEQCIMCRQFWPCLAKTTGPDS